MKNSNSHNPGGPPVVDEDSELVDRARFGDEEAFTALYARHFKHVCDFVHRNVRNRADAEEIAQDVFVRAHRSIGNFRGECKFKSWIFQIAHNLCRNHYWYWTRRKRIMWIHYDQPSAVNSWLSMEDLLPSEEPDSREKLESDEHLTAVHRAMSELVPKFRDILVLRIVRDLSYLEIGSILGIEIGTVKSRISRGRGHLEKKVAQYN